MRRNALKNRKLSQTKKWRREKQRRSGKHSLISTKVKQRRTVSLLSKVSLKDLTVRVRRHSVDFLLNCKDPKSKERALLQQLEEVKPKDNRLNQLNSTGEGNKSCTLNVKSFTLSSMSVVGRSSLNGKPVKVDRRAVQMAVSSRTTSMVHTRITHRTQSRNLSNTTSLCDPIDEDKTCSAIIHVKGEKAITVSKRNKCHSVKSHIITPVQNPATEETGCKAIRASSQSGACQSVTEGSKKAADNPQIYLKQYVTVNLTRLPVSQSLGCIKTSKDEKARVVVRGRCRQSQRLRPNTLTEKRVSICQQTQGGSSDMCSPEGNRGVREMFFKAVNTVETCKTMTESLPCERNDKVIEIQTVSEEDNTTTQKKQQDVLKDKKELQKEKTNSASPVVQCKHNRGLDEVKESESKIVSNKRSKRQSNIHCNIAIADGSKQEGVPKMSEQIKRSLDNQPMNVHEEDVVIKQAKVLLSDILKKDKSLINMKLQGDTAERQFSIQAFEEILSSKEKVEAAEINGNRFHTLVRKKMRRGKTRSRRAKTKTEDKQCTKGQLSKDVSSTIKMELSDERLQLHLPQCRSDPSVTCPNQLPHKSVISKTNLHPDTNPQAHTQSNIPLKKRTFRSAVEMDSEQNLDSASHQNLKKGPELSTASRQDLPSCSGESSKVTQDGKVRLRKTEVQRLAPRKTKQTSYNRVLRSRASEAPRSHLWRKARKCKSEIQDDCNNFAEIPAKTSQPCAVNGTLNKVGENEQEEKSTLEQSDLEETKPVLNFKMRFKRRRGKVWEMQNAGFENMLKKEKGNELGSCDPYKAIMDSVSILNKEMEAAQAHVQACKNSKSRFHRLKKRRNKRNEKLAMNLTSRVKSDKDLENADNGCGPSDSPNNKQDIKEKIDREVGDTQLSEKVECQKVDPEMLPVVRQEAKIEDRFLKNCCLFESESQQKQQQELDSNGFQLPVIKLRRKNEDIWEVDSKGQLVQSELKMESTVKKELKGHSLGMQKRGCLDVSKFKEECQFSQSLNSNAAPLKTELPPFSLSLSPLSLSSPLNDSKSEIVSPAAERIIDRLEINSGGRKQRHKMDRACKCGPVETPTACLSHTLQQIDNSLSRLSEGLCSSQTLEKPTTCSSASVIQPSSQSPPFTTADNMLSGEPNFTNCCDDLLDFQCLNFEGYYQPQNILPSSPSDLCSLDPPTDPFSSPLSHSPSDTWTTETPYLGPPSPENNFTGEDLQFFPGLISKNDSIPLEFEAKDASKDRNTANPGFSFSSLGTSDFVSKERSKNLGMRLSKEDTKAQSFSVASKPRMLATPSVVSQNSVNFSQSSINFKPSTSQSKIQSNLKTQGPFHRMTIPSKSQSFPSSHPNAARGVPQSCSTKPVMPSQNSNKFLSPQLFTVRNPNPSDNPFNFHEKNSTVIHRVLKFQGGSQPQNLYSAPCKDTVAAGSPTVLSRPLSAKVGAIEKMQHSQKFGVNTDNHQKSNVSIHGFGKDVGHLGSSSNPSRSSLHFDKNNPSMSQSFNKIKIPPGKHNNSGTNLTCKNFSDLPRPFFFPSKVDSYSSQQNRSLKHDKSSTSTSDKHQPCYTQQDPFDFSFGSNLSAMSQHNSPQVVHSTPPTTPTPANKSQSTTSSASFPYSYQGPPYVLNFSGDHSLTLGLRDGTDGYPGLGSTNYTYHCLMEPSGTQGRLVLEPCGPQMSNNPASLSLGGFSGLRAQEEHCRKDMQHCQPGDHQGTSHYVPVNTSHSMGSTKPKRVRLVVTDGTVDLDLQYSD